MTLLDREKKSGKRKKDLNSIERVRQGQSVSGMTGGRGDEFNCKKKKQTYHFSMSSRARIVKNGKKKGL